MEYTKNDAVFKPISSNPRFLDLTGTVYERLTVLGYAGMLGSHPMWWCECECKAVVQVNRGNLRNGHTTSCGCRRDEIIGSVNRSHGMTDSAEYRSYSHAKGRCENPTDPKFPLYGQRGIKFLFNSFEDFFAELGPKPEGDYSVDRKDVDGHYEVGNVQWATPKQQGRNQTTNRRITLNGVTKIFSEWADESEVHVNTLKQRLYNLKWCEVCTFTLPLGGRCLHKN